MQSDVMPLAFFFIYRFMIHSLLILTHTATGFPYCSLSLPYVGEAFISLVVNEMLL